MGAMEALYADHRSNIDERVLLRPFSQEPPHGITEEQFRAKYREDMISNAGFTIFLGGNKLDSTSGRSIIANGVLEEFEITKRLGKYPIPVGATGYAARQIWQEVTSSLDHFYPRGGVKSHFRTLGNPNKAPEEIVNAIFAIAKQAVSK